MKRSLISRHPSLAALLAFWSLTANSGAPSSSLVVKSLRPFIERHELAGAVTLIVSKDATLDLEAVGYADVAAKRAARANDLFWIASMSKPITATALMMLIDDGKVQLDDPVQKYLPAFLPQIVSVTADGENVSAQPPAALVTVRSLLTHTSGLPYNSSFETPTHDLFPLATAVRGYGLDRLMSEPGARFSYSNDGFNTIGRVIEVVSGMRYEDFLNSRLFRPLGMTDTTFWPTESQLDRLAKSYKRGADRSVLEEISIDQLRYPLSDRTHRFPMPSGGLFSTASDLAKFCQMMLNRGTIGGRRLLSEAAIREMTRNQLSGSALKEIAEARERPTDPEGYGLGWFIYPSGIVGHGGAYSTDMRIDFQHGIAFVWLVQHPGEGGRAEEAFQELVAKYYITASTAVRK
jgi:CubicO group peptidase (beta-lactamase class C family)